LVALPLGNLTSGGSDVIMNVITPSSASETPAPDLQPATGSSGTDAISETTAVNLSAEDALKEINSLKAALKKTNAESAGHRHKAKELDELKARLEAEKLTETEKLQNKNSELQASFDALSRRYQERTVNYEVRLQAAKMGIVDPDAAVKLLEWSEIEREEDGAPKNIEKLLEKLLKEKPYLSLNQNPSQASASPVPQLPAMNPGRSSITQPGSLQPGQVTRLHDLWRKK
jgi:hypothetical protein